MIYTLIIIILLLIFIFLIIKKNNLKKEDFENYLPVLKTYKCFATNQKVIEFINDMNKILDKYKINDGEIEMSTKFTNKKINPNRIVVFIPYKYISKKKEIKTDCYKINKIPEEVQKNLDKSIKNTEFTYGQLLFGIDEGDHSRRVYFNYQNMDKVFLHAYNITEKVIAKKIYKQLKNNVFKKELQLLIGDKLYNKLLDIFPENLWKIIGVKDDSRIKRYKYSTFYINLNFEYKLEQFSSKILDFIRHIYKGDNESLIKWYNCYKNNNITWLSIGRDKKGKILFTLYLVYNRNIRDFVDTEKIVSLNNSLKLLDSLFSS